MTIAATNHGLSVGQRVNIKVNSMTFTCSQDSNATEHEYPRPTDPAAGDWIAITSVPNDHEFVINVSASPSGQQYTHLLFLQILMPLQSNEIALRSILMH